MKTVNYAVVIADNVPYVGTLRATNFGGRAADARQAFDDATARPDVSAVFLFRGGRLIMAMADVDADTLTGKEPTV